MDWKWTAWSGLDRDELYEIIVLRQRVFIVEQACAYADLDGLDPAAYHLQGRVDGVLAAYLRAFPLTAERPEQVIGRVIVAPEHRGKGIASALIREAHARMQPERSFYLGAQAHLQGFYANLGYRVCGEGYDEDGIPHLPMRRPAQTR